MRNFILLFENRIAVLLVLLISLTLNCCKEEIPLQSQAGQLNSMVSIEGKKEYLNTPFVAAGDQLYMVGHQNGLFPDMGWHITGEMGGIWCHPIKLMDGFQLNISTEENSWCLDSADQFVNFPVGNIHRYTNDVLNLKVTRSQFVPDATKGIVIEYLIKNEADSTRKFKVGFTGMIDLRPTWLGERTDMIDDEDDALWDDENQAVIAKDKSNSWYVVFGSSLPSTLSEQIPCKKERIGKGVDAAIATGIEIQAREEKIIRFVISGSFTNREEAISTYTTLLATSDNLLQQKIDRYKTISASASLSIENQQVNQMYNWVKYNTDWLIRDVDIFGRGLSAGLPDYPWWFGADNAYALQGMLATGRFDEVISTIDLIHKISEKENGDNGRIIHEASTNGAVYNPGNLNETPHFAYLIWKTFEWTGDKMFLEKYYPFVQKGLAWMEEQDKDKNFYPDGPGMMEIHGLHSEMIDVVVYTQRAYQAAAFMAKQVGDETNAVAYQEKADQLKQKINSEWWSAGAKSFADFRSTRQQALDLTDQAIVRADTLNKPWAVADLKQTKSRILENNSTGTNGYVVHHNWVVNTPMEMQVADPEKARLALETARRYSNRFGMFVTGIDRDESQEASSKWKSFSYVGAVMTLPTGVQTIAECNYGNADEALKYLEKLSNSFSYALPGSLYEVSPDYGMFVQAWTIYAVAVPIVTHFFGIKPKAYEQEVIIQPEMPSSWANAKLENVKVGDNAVSIAKSTVGGQVVYEIDQTLVDWKIKFRLPIQSNPVLKVNGKSTEPISHDEYYVIELSGNHNKIEIVR